MSPREMESEAKREGTFSNHPWPHSGTPLTPGRLAAAGFYAAPTPKARDRVVCFACDNALTHWDTTDDPMKEHSTWYPQCPFVQGKPTGNIPRRRNIVPKLPTTPTTESITCAEFPSASQSADGEIEGRAGVGSRDRANGGENNYGLIAGEKPLRSVCLDPCSKRNASCLPARPCNTPLHLHAQSRSHMTRVRPMNFPCVLTFCWCRTISDEHSHSSKIRSWQLHTIPPAPRSWRDGGGRSLAEAH